MNNKVNIDFDSLLKKVTNSAVVYGTYFKLEPTQIKKWIEKIMLRDKVYYYDRSKSIIGVCASDTSRIIAICKDEAAESGYVAFVSTTILKGELFKAKLMSSSFLNNPYTSNDGHVVVDPDWELIRDGNWYDYSPEWQEQIPNIGSMEAAKLVGIDWLEMPRTPLTESVWTAKEHYLPLLVKEWFEKPWESEEMRHYQKDALRDFDDILRTEEEYSPDRLAKLICRQYADWINCQLEGIVDAKSIDYKMAGLSPKHSRRKPWKNNTGKVRRKPKVD